MQELPDGSIVLPQHLQYERKAMAKGRREHFTGHFVFGPNEGKAMDFESNTEFRIALVVLARPGVVDLENQVPFRWRDTTGKVHTHFFDFRASQKDGSRIAIMVKAAHRLKSERLRAELAAIAAQVTPDFADRVVIMTEKDLDPVELFNAEIVHEFRRSDPVADAAARRAVQGLVGAARIEDLVETIGLGADGFRALVRLVGTRELELTEAVRISHDAFVRRRAA
ncbi:MAG: hypothetical protein JXJ18_08235 [Rhodobacteraceae bacterium]|nr:hypothetical protein [Paracoccaceae bacterium]